MYVIPSVFWIVKDNFEIKWRKSKSRMLYNQKSFDSVTIKAQLQRGI